MCLSSIAAQLKIEFPYSVDLFCSKIIDMEDVVNVMCQTCGPHLWFSNK
jgi:hypothetical protein